MLRQEQLLRHPAHLAILFALLAGMPAAAVNAEEAAPAAGVKWKAVFSPGSDLYPRYIADPLRPTFALTAMTLSDTDIADAGESRFGISIGGRYGLVRFHPPDRPDRGVQIDIEVGFYGQFDRDSSTDNIGWDGLYGLQVAWAPLRRLTFRFGTHHDSSHVGDEFVEETGRQRINYTRQELLFGTSWSCADYWRLYAEGGYGYDLRNEELMEPGRGKFGLEYDGPATIWKGRLGYYAALDVSLFEENDWESNLSFQTGVRYRVPEQARVFRAGLQYYDGRSLIGEFFLAPERFFALGLWFDL